MRGRDKNPLLSLLLGTGLYLLDPVRDRLADQIDSLSGRAKDAYSTTRGRIRKASRAITREDRRDLGSTAALLVGVGVGVALGILFAPASGEQVRRSITESFQEVGGRVRGEPHGTGPTPAERL